MWRKRSNLHVIQEELGNLCNMLFNVKYCLFSEMLVRFAVPQYMLRGRSRSAAVWILANVGAGELSFEQAMRRAHTSYKDPLQDTPIFLIEEGTAAIMFCLAGLEGAESRLPVHDRCNASKIFAGIA